jgi:hypothetical protein
VLRWRPKLLLESILRPAILALSNGGAVKTVTEEACARFLEASARPGQETHSDPNTLARDFCAIISNVLEKLSRMVLLNVSPGGCVPVGEHHWKVAAYKDESGILHRWTTVDRWDDDAQFRELHSWACFGDCAAGEVGMCLHVIEIGQQRRGHQHTSWARAFGHPAIIGKYRFQKVGGGPLEGNWKAVWFQDSAKNEAKTWVDLMEADNLELIHHINIAEPRKEHVEQFRREVASEAARMAAVGSWEDEVMRRTSCDLPYPCPWQPACYSPPGPVNVEALGFVKIKS